MSERQSGFFISQEARETAADFLRRHGMHYDRLNPQEELEKFMAAMEEDYRRGGATGRMIPTWIGDYHIPEREERRVSVIDIGGTNVRSAVVTAGPDGIRNIENLQSFRTPGVDEETDTAGFYEGIVRGVQDNLVTDEIGICFSLATIPQKDRDAVMVAGGKQIKITDMLGKKVGESFRQAMRTVCPEKAERGRITVINDTVAAALGGQAQMGDRHALCSSYIGFIYGTGINMCYREKTGEWINTETAAYCTFPTGDLDDAFDAGMIDPGGDRLEKMVSGGYQGGLMTCILKAAAAEGLIRRESLERMRQAVLERSRGTFREGRKTLSTRDLSAFSAQPKGDNVIAAACAGETERELIAAICDDMTERSALVCSVVLTAGLLRCGGGTSPDAPVFITAEGSTYLKQKDFKEKLSRRMDMFAGARHGLSFSFHTVPDVILKGIAVACLSA